jgi:hypothetical protein
MGQMIRDYQAGVNLGGWISQYRQIDHDHFRTFITESDLAQIARWGMDHVRLPVDYPVLESDDAPGTYLENGLAYIDQCLAWCQHYGLRLILDLHRAPGYTFTNTLESDTGSLNTLFSDDAMQRRFIRLWEFMTWRYLPVTEGLIFELMNEVVLPDSQPWNQLAQRTIAAVRAIDPQRGILIGGNQYNAVTELKNLTLFDDPQVYYTFHFYEPLLFTHQKASWAMAARRYNQSLDYPGSFTGLAAFLESAPEFEATFGWLKNKTMDRQLIMEFLRPAQEFLEHTGRPLYCGEFGVIEGAPAASSVAWHRDFISALTDLGVGGAVWTYKQMDFGLVDSNSQVINETLVKVVSRAAARS